MAEKLYADSGIELTPTIAKHYDGIMNFISFRKYEKFIRNAVKAMDIRETDHILDMGCGTGKNAQLVASYLGDEGRITGIDLSPVMEKQFLARHHNDPRIEFRQQRVDIPFQLGKNYDRVLISFVIHGFPQEVREQILANAREHLKPGGKLMILDFAEFDMDAMPWHHRLIFKTVECVYAFDYIKRDWKEILSGAGFGEFSEQLYFRNYARLLMAERN